MPGQQNFIDSAKGNIPYPGVTSATSDPSSSNDNTQGFIQGSIWYNTTTSRVWECMSNSTGAAVWAFTGVVPGVGSEPSNMQTLFGGGAGSFFEEGNLVRSTPSNNPATTNADVVLAAYSIPANSFDQAGRALNVFAQGDVANNTNSKRIKIYYGCTTAVVGSAVTGGTVIADTGAYTTTGAAGWIAEANIVKYGANGSNTQRGLHASAQIGSTVGALIPSTALTATESGAILVAITGNAATATTDITLQFFEVNAMN